MHILYIHQYFSTRQGANGTRSYEFARALVARGHRVTMLCGSTAASDTGLTGPPPVKGSTRRGTVDGIEVVEICVPYSNHLSLPRRALAFLQFCLLASWRALREPCDLVFATSTPLTVALPALCARWLRGKPFVFEVRDLWPELPVAMGLIKNPLLIRALRALEILTYKSAACCIALAPGIADGICETGIPRNRVKMIPNGCDLDLFEARTARFPHPAVKPNDFVAIFSGAHGMANGLDAVLDAAAELKKHGHDSIKFVFIGDGKTKPKLIERASKEALSNCIFLDPVRKERLAEMLPCADVGLMILANVPAFYFGTSPNKFFDYLACGLPVLVNYPGWVANLVKEHECGIAVPPGDPQAFAEALKLLESLGQKRATMRAKARALAGSQFQRLKLANDLVTTLDEVLNNFTASKHSAKNHQHHE